MRNVQYFSLFILVALIFFACKADKPCVPKTVESEMAVMNKFATDSTITVTQDASGLLYQIIDPGTGVAPSTASTITVKYTGRLMNGTQFDANDNLNYPLNRLIQGWQIGLPKIKVGGKIKLIIPSSLAYGCDGALPNQPLYFYIE